MSEMTTGGIMSRETEKHLRFFAIYLGVIMLCMVVLFVSVSNFNNQERVLYYTAAGSLEDNSNKHCAVTIRPRGGSTDTWIKRITETDENGEIQEVQYAGIIYDIMVTNRTELTVKDWRLEVAVAKDSFLNNAWCGQLEIHQNLSNNECVQTLDLRKCIETEVPIVLEHAIEGTDLMIPIYKGDYFVYLPSTEVQEDIIQPSDIEIGNFQNKRVDFIAYHKTVNDDLTPIEYSNAKLTYHLHKDIFQLPVFWALVGLIGVWFICFVTTLVVGKKTRRLLKQTERDAEIIEQSMSAFMRFIDAKDPSTNGHSMRVAQYARKLAHKLGMVESECERVYYIALMHDCGKIGIPDAILNKPDKLTEEEFEIIKTHTTQGDKILQNFTSIEGIREGALYHHERFDGTGYPSGLKGEEIPLIARIICVADCFDVMNSERCYKQKLTKEDILEQLKVNKGKQFDPELVEHFLAMLSDGTIEF